MANMTLVKGVTQTIPGTKAGGGTVQFTSTSAAAPIYVEAWLNNIEVAWHKWQPSQTSSFAYPANDRVDITAGANCTLNVTVT